MSEINTFIEEHGLTKLADKLANGLGQEVTPQRLNNWRERGVPWELVYPVSDILGVEPHRVRSRNKAHANNL